MVEEAVAVGCWLLTDYILLFRKLIGSTSEYLTHHLDCPVLVVKLHADK
jgi:hypothetical protein